MQLQTLGPLREAGFVQLMPMNRLYIEGVFWCFVLLLAVGWSVWSIIRQSREAKRRRKSNQRRKDSRRD